MVTGWGGSEGRCGHRMGGVWPPDGRGVATGWEGWPQDGRGVATGWEGVATGWGGSEGRCGHRMEEMSEDRNGVRKSKPVIDSFT